MVGQNKIFSNKNNLPAGSFALWLRQIRKALTRNRVMNVPCGECDACCRSSYFIHINPEETRTLSRIPNELLFPAPLRPEGHMVLGYDEQGRCPMLIGNTCSIYRNRPTTCCIFDCRVLVASGLTGEDDENNPIFQQARRWQFNYPTKRDRNLFSAIQAAAAFLRRHPECIQKNLVPMDAIQISIAAIKVYDVFLKTNDPFVYAGKLNRDSEIAKEVFMSYKKFKKRMRAA
jgi:Fe-S-cluster containining protein